MKILKVVLITIVVIIVLAVVGIYIALQKIDRQALKTTLIHQLEQATGRDVQADELDFNFSILKGVAFALKGFSISDPALDGVGQSKILFRQSERCRIDVDHCHLAASLRQHRGQDRPRPDSRFPSRRLSGGRGPFPFHPRRAR